MAPVALGGLTEPPVDIPPPNSDMNLLTFFVQLEFRLVGSLAAPEGAHFDPIAETEVLPWSK